MKFANAVLLLMIAALSGCAEQMAGKSLIETEAGHIGCQEGEIDENGICVIAEDSNVKLFGLDLDKYVDSKEVRNDASGFLAMPKEAGEHPGIVMIHEWWGLNDNIREMAKLLAKEGYTVFAVDLYGVEAATDSTKARELATSVRQNPDKAVQDMKSAVQYLRGMGVEKMASLGWCFGGQHSLLLSLNEDLDATVIYYGQLIDDKEKLRNINWPVLGIFGEEDTSITVDSVRSFESALNELGIKNQIYVYPGVGHAFANPSGSNYAAEETIDAWGKTIKFLNDELKEIKVFQVTGISYRFFIGERENPEIRVKQGDKIRIEFTSTEGFHDWVVDEFNAATERVSAGSSAYVEFVADRKGTFEYYCSVGNHRQQGMFGNLIVE